MAKKHIRIIYRPSGEIIAEGPIGWGITPFEGNYYIQKKYLCTTGFKPSFVPGICIYKFFYVWMDLIPRTGERARMLGWLYWLPNPLFPFIWYRIGVPQRHPELTIEKISPKLAEVANKSC